MRTSYVLADYKSVHCLHTGALTLRYSRTFENASRSGPP